MRMPKLSVIMSVYDGVKADELVEAVDSILRQTLSDFEFLIMKDAVEREDLLKYLNQLAQRDSRVKLFGNSQRSGNAHSLNRLVEQASGEFLARMDADDISLPERFERQCRYLDQHPNVDLIGTFAREVDSQGHTLFDKRLPVGAAEIRRFMSKRDPFVHPTVMFRRSFFAQHGLYSESPQYRLLEDTELWARALAAQCEGANIPEFLFHFRASPAMYKRRRGVALAWNEVVLRLKYCWRSGLPWYYLAFPLMVGILRVSPPAITEFAYRRLRG
jgi:glycosyltransferase involved in cell wall biosynthesis